MPSATHRSKPPSYRLHKARNQAFVQFRGRRFYLGTYGTEESKERYRRFLAEVWVKADAAQVVIQPAPDITVVEVTAAYWQHAEGYYVTNGQPSGWLYHIRLVLRVLRELYGTSPAAEFGPIRLKTLRDQLILGNRSRKYVNKLVGVGEPPEAAPEAHPSGAILQGCLQPSAPSRRGQGQRGAPGGGVGPAAPLASESATARRGNRDPQRVRLGGDPSDPRARPGRRHPGLCRAGCGPGTECGQTDRLGIICHFSY